MTRFFRLWIAFTVVLIVATVGISVWFRHVDLTFESVAHLIVVPVCQAVVVSLAGWPAGGARLRPLIREATTHPLALPVLAMDAGLFATGWLLTSDQVWGMAAPGGVQATWIGTKTIAASMFLLRAAMRSWRDLSDPEPRPSDRAGLVGLAALLFAAGSNAFVPWLPRVAEMMFAGLPLVLRWLSMYGVLLAAALILATRVAGVLRRRSRTAAALVDAAAAAAFAAAMLAVLNVYQRRYLAGTWLGVIRTLGSAGATFVLIAGILAASDRQPERP